MNSYFVERDVGNTFPYKKTKDDWAIKNGLPYEIELCKTENKRYARILKTVAYVAVDEDEYGKPVLEKWHLKRNIQMPEV